MEELNVKELKAKLLEHGLNEEQIDEKFEALKETSALYKTPNGKRIAYIKIAKENKVPLQTISANAVAEAFPMKIEEALDTDKVNMTLTGYCVSGFRANKNGDFYVDLSDDTGIVTFKVWSSDAEFFEDEIDKLKIDEFTPVKIKNLHWKDKKWQPNFSAKYSAIEVVDEPPFAFNEIKPHSTKDMLNEKIYTLKLIGMVVSVEASSLQSVYHCECGKWFKGASDSDVGSLSQCEKCGEPTEVRKSLNGKFLFGDRDGIAEIDVSVFSGLTELNEDDEVFVRGKYQPDTNTIRSWDVTVLKKN